MPLSQRQAAVNYTLPVIQSLRNFLFIEEASANTLFRLKLWLCDRSTVLATLESEYDFIYEPPQNWRLTDMNIQRNSVCNNGTVKCIVPRAVISRLC